MKRTCFLLLLTTFLCQSMTAQQLELNPISQLNWLKGKWERIINNSNQSGYEEWEGSDRSLKGLGVTIQQGDTVFAERLSIESKDSEWYYVAEVNSNAEPTYFKITEISDAGFVSENPGHDFPKKIEYQLSGAGEMKVIISGDDRSVPFVFRKIEK